MQAHLTSNKYIASTNCITLTLSSVFIIRKGQHISLDQIGQTKYYENIIKKYLLDLSPNTVHWIPN